MKRKKKKKFLALLLLVAGLIGLLPTEPIYAASSYSNAKEFYESTRDNGELYHAETVNGTIYYATSAKLASSSSNERYYTLGFDITLSGNGHSVSFAVQRTGGSMIEIDSRTSGGYEYILYAVQDYSLYNLATAANPTEAAYVLSSSTIVVTMNAIMTTRLGNSLRGGITENGSGGLYESGSVYHLKEYSHLMAMMRKFAGHDFGSYINIREYLDNPSLLIQYNVQGTTGGSVSVGGGFGVSNGILTAGGSTYIQTNTLLQPVSLLNPSSIGLTKPGYYIEPGKEWIALNRTFTSSQIYMPMGIYPNVANGSAGITMYANWQVNTYYILYDANGGEGYVHPSTLKYDESAKLRACTYTRRGYSLAEGAEWNTKPDGTGISYSSSEVVKNLSDKNGDTIKLYANWIPNTYEIMTDKGNGSGGTDTFYEKYDHGWYSDKDTTQAIANIQIPVRIGYDFLGYLLYSYGVGDLIVDTTGNIMVNSNFFADDSMIYATYNPKKYTVTFDKQGGSGGSDTVVATFDEYLPYAEAPIKSGYSFKGYYGDVNYTGEIWYIETMAPNIRYTTPNDVTLYAKWVDDILPNLSISVSTSNWTNRAEGIEVNTYAYDMGSGLDKVELYCDDVLVAEQSNLNGTKETVKIEYMHKLEGVYRYRTVAYDIDGNVTEKYESVKYDVKAPTGTFNVINPDLNNFNIDVLANDYNIQYEEGTSSD